MSTQEKLIIYTDGACSGNPGPAGLGVYMTYKGRKRFIYRYLGTATNNIAELSAILVALESVKKPEMEIDLYSDSSYSIGVLLKNWKAKKNKELIASIKSKLQEFPNLKIKKIAGHAGIEGNEMADTLARKAVESRESDDYYG